MPAFALVGLPEAVVRESKERVRAALVTAGYDFPQRRITVNLSPADLPKEGGRFDLPIAVGILAADGKIPTRALKQREFYGELSLGGELRETPKLLPALIAGAKLGSEMILPAANALEASLVARRESCGWLNNCGEVMRRAQRQSRTSRERPRSKASQHSHPASRHAARISPRFAASTPPSAPWKSPPPANMDC